MASEEGQQDKRRLTDLSRILLIQRAEILERKGRVNNSLIQIAQRPRKRRKWKRLRRRRDREWLEQQIEERIGSAW